MNHFIARRNGGLTSRPWGTIAACLALAWCAANAVGQTKDSPAAELSHGPMLGRQTARSMAVWGRTSRPGKLQVWYGEQADKLDQRSGETATNRDQDLTGVVEVQGLTPATQYHYQLAVDGKPAGKPGVFRTLPDQAAMVDPKLNPQGLFNFRFEFACGNNQNAGHGLGPTMPTYATMLKKIRDEVDFAVLNGDWLYEFAREFPADQWRRQVGLNNGQPSPKLVERCPSVVGVWQNYKAYLEQSPNLAEWHRHVPSYYTFDDHEILNDVIACGEAGFRNRRAVFRDIGVQAWYDYLGWSNPTAHTAGIHFGMAQVQAGDEVLVDAEADFTKLSLHDLANLHIHWGGQLAGVNEDALDHAGGEPAAGVYDVVEVLGKNRLRIRPAPKADGRVAYSIGRRSYGKMQVANCMFYFLDTRTHRQMHDVKRRDKPGVSMLGQGQREWLLREMKAAKADFHFVISSVNFMIPHVGGGGVAFDAETKDDAWTAFIEEREKLIDFWDGLGRPVFVLTGDLHNSFAVKITDRVWEFASGPHNSYNHRPVDEGGRPATGKFQFGPRPCSIRWSSHVQEDIPRDERRFPHFCTVQVNNVYNNPLQQGGLRWVAYPHPQVIFQFFDGYTGDLRYSETISTLME